MKTKHTRPADYQRERQQTPGELVGELMGVIRRQFYAELPERKWFQDQHLVKAWFVLWPARWLDQRGVTLAPERYREILLGILDTIKVHGDTGAVKYWPRYLLAAVQSHFRVNGDRYYEEGKSVRTALERALATAQRSQAAAPDPIRVLAEAGQVLAAGKRRKKVVAQPQERLLFDL